MRTKIHANVTLLTENLGTGHASVDTCTNVQDSIPVVIPVDGIKRSKAANFTEGTSEKEVFSFLSTHILTEGRERMNNMALHD